MCDGGAPCGHPAFIVGPPLAAARAAALESARAYERPAHPALIVPVVARTTPATYRSSPIGFGILAVLLTLSQLADLVTGYLERPAGWVGIERNPLAAALLANPAMATAAKLALLALVVSVVAIIRVTRPRAAILVLMVGISAGIIGALSNAT